MVECEQLQHVNGLCFHLHLQEYYVDIYIYTHTLRRTHSNKIKILRLPCYRLNYCFPSEITACYQKSITLQNNLVTGNFDARCCAAFQL